MTWLYLIVIVFAALTLYFVYVEFKQKPFLKKAFAIISILESVVIIANAVFLVMSF